MKQITAVDLVIIDKMMDGRTRSSIYFRCNLDDKAAIKQMK